jgi:SAM-dependent methyltransferase
LYGTDINRDAVRWGRRHLTYAHWGENRVEAALDYDDATFDLVYATSVFTHLSERLHHTWMAELRRVTREGGILVFTTHGERYLGDDMESRARFAAGELVTRHAAIAGSNVCAAFHPPSYVKRVTRDWDLLDYRSEGWNGQDLWAVRRRSDAEGPERAL